MGKFIKASHDRKTLTVQYVSDNMDILLRSGGTIAWRFNNPGNMRPKKNSIYPGQIGVGDTASGKFVIFQSYEIGRREKKALLRRSYNDLSLHDALYKYAPSNENDTEKYIAFLVKSIAIKKNMVLSSLSDSEIEKLMNAMETYEGYNGQKSTRKEKWVQTTTINVSDGSSPLSNKKITVEHNKQKKEYKTNKYGDLPIIPHINDGDSIKLSTLVDGTEKLIAEVVTSTKSQTIKLVNSVLKYSSQLIPQNGIIKDDKYKKINYIVVNNDTLLKISKRFRVSVHQIQEWNYLKNPNQIYSGQILTIGGYSDKKNKSTGKKQRGKPYKIKQGDTIGKICRNFGLNIKDLENNNPHIINIDLIKVGEIIYIPEHQLKNKTVNLKDNVIKQKNVEISRSKSGTGEGLAILSLTSKEAPWMTIVLRELKQWYGISESNITDNYHKLSGSTWIKSLEGTDNAWCASFANYCLQEANYKKSNNPASALSFRRDQINFSKISEPIFGALATIPTSKNAKADATSGAGHVAFVYALDKKDGNFLMIGGNQGDQITIVSRKISSFRFYIPSAYSSFAKSQKLEKQTTVDELYQLLGLKSVKTSDNTR